MLALLGFGYVAAMLCGGLVFFNAMPTPFSAWLSGTKVQQVVRMVTMTMAMVHCWCLYFAGAWVMAASDIAEFLGVYEDSALLKVILACVLTVYAFVLIFVLEYLASLDATGPKADQAIYTIMGSLGILVGFTWEQVTWLGLGFRLGLGLGLGSGLGASRYPRRLHVGAGAPQPEPEPEP